MQAPQMNDKITIQVVDSNGGKGAVQEFTIREYAENVIAMSDAIISDEQATAEAKNEAQKQKTFVEQMLNYGATTQIYFNHNANDLANKNIGSVKLVDVPETGYGTTKKEGTLPNLSFYGATLLMSAQTDLRLYFELKGGSISEYTFAYNGKTLKVVSRGGNYYSVDVVGIAPNKLDEGFKVEVNGGAFSVTYYPMSYIIRQYLDNSDTESALDFYKRNSTKLVKYDATQRKRVIQSDDSLVIEFIKANTYGLK
jgi:hypothetical protein